MDTELTFRIAFWALFAGVIILRLYFSMRVRRSGERLMPDRQAIRREGVGSFIARVVLFFCLIGWLILYAIYPPWMASISFILPAWLRWVGFVLGAGSLALWIWTQSTLDTLWSAQLQLRPEHHLVTNGPYAHIRHPLYAAMILLSIAFSLVTANWFFILLSALAILGMIVRVPREEQMMIEHFGREYQTYMHQTGRFFPR